MAECKTRHVSPDQVLEDEQLPLSIQQVKHLGVKLESSNLRADVLELLSFRQSDSPEGCLCDGTDCHMSVDFVLSPGVIVGVVRVGYS